VSTDASEELQGPEKRRNLNINMWFPFSIIIGNGHNSTVYTLDAPSLALSFRLVY
jgi:hypothetical protein